MLSCISVKEINEIAPLYKAKGDFLINDLQGKFANQPTQLNQNGGEPLGKFFFAPFKEYEWGEDIDLEGHIQILPISSEELKIQLWKSDTLCCETNIGGKVKGNYFEINRRIRVGGVPLIYFKSHERKIILSISEKGNLILKQGRNDIGNVLIFSGGSDAYTSFEFKRIN